MLPGTMPCHDWPRGRGTHTHPADQLVALQLSLGFMTDDCTVLHSADALIAHREDILVRCEMRNSEKMHFSCHFKCVLKLKFHNKLSM